MFDVKFTDFGILDLRWDNLSSLCRILYIHILYFIYYIIVVVKITSRLLIRRSGTTRTVYTYE